MKRDIVYIHLPSKGKAPKLEAASQTVCRWGSWMGWIDDSRLEARMPSPSSPLAFISQSCLVAVGEDGGGGREQRQVLSPPHAELLHCGSSQIGQLLCLAPPPVLAVLCVCFIKLVFQQAVKELAASAGWFCSGSSVWNNCSCSHFAVSIVLQIFLLCTFS